MKEELIDIVKELESFEPVKRVTRVDPIARVHGLFDGKADNIWFTSDYIRREELKGFGRFVPKNSNLAIRMQTIEVGSSFSYEQMNFAKRKKEHYVVLENRTNLQNHTIAIAGDNLLYQYRNISDFLEALRQNKAGITAVLNHIAALEQQSANLKPGREYAQERASITKSINACKEQYRVLTQQQEDLKNITIYIRKQGEMRYSLIVDPVQTRIKSQNLFDGKTIVIDGGPGTGKSTTMIHRLRYLTDKFAIEEDKKKHIYNYKLDLSQRDQLLKAIDGNRDWMFFSPSQLLKEYLADAMKKENLSNLSEKVWNWKDYCQWILQSKYHLLEINKAPFKICKLTDTLFYQGFDIISEFTNYYVGQLRESVTSLPEINNDGNKYIWTVITNNIQKKIEESKKADISDFVRLFNSLENLYGDDCKSMLVEKKAKVNNLVGEICVLLDNNMDVKDELEDLIDFTDEESDNLQEENDVAEDESNEKLPRLIQKWVEAYAYSKVNESVDLTDEQQLISEPILSLIGSNIDTQLQKIGELIIFEKYAQFTEGVRRRMLNVIPSLYKKFRSYLIRTKYTGCDLKLLRDIKQRKDGKELHHQEQSLLLGFINTLVKKIIDSHNTSVKHPYIDAYKEVARPIIGIDEATDFSACDIYAMQSLLSREFSSLTLCGDMMQRLTSYGIKSWKELEGIVPNLTVVEMKTSYRQSVKLLDVARQLYKDTLGATPPYMAFMKSKKVPVPLAFVNENESVKIKWISDRIAEVFRAYGEQLPSIAIFVNDKGWIPRFAESLQKTEFFAKNGVKVIDGTSANNKTKDQHICVYPIDVVKGMEFDVVFFHNVDNYSFDIENLKRFIYVGVSRAAFFLGITMSEQRGEVCKYFVQNKDWFKI